MPMQYEIGEANHLGNRNNNQDRFTAVETDEGILLVLADGMGGHAGGEVAAQTLVDLARDRYLNATRPIPTPQAGQFLAEIIRETHELLLRLAVEHDLHDIPGTTAVMCLIQGNRMDWAHVGDSRLYLFRASLPVFRTIDHSYVEQLYQQGVISRSEQDTHPRRNHITQCIGCLPQMPEVELGKGKNLLKGDVIMLCSDGLWSALDDAQLGAMLSNDVLDDVVERMAMRAEQLSYPHSDNISVLALRVLSVERAPHPEHISTPAPPRQEKRTPKPKHVDEEKLKSAIEQIEEALRTYGDELKR